MILDQNTTAVFQIITITTSIYFQIMLHLSL